MIGLLRPLAIPSQMRHDAEQALDDHQLSPVVNLMLLAADQHLEAAFVPWTGPSACDELDCPRFGQLFDAALLAVLYRNWRLWLIQELTLLFAVGAMVASMKLCNVPLNLLNVLSFRLVLAIGVDYGIYVLLVWQKTHELEHDVAGVVKPVLLAGLTAVSGFGSLGLAKNPSLSGLGITCAIGIFWSLVATIFFTLPAAAAVEPKSWRPEPDGR